MKLSKKIKEFKTERAQMELSLRLIQFLNKFESKEEPMITLSDKDKISVLLSVANKKLDRLK